MAPTDTAWNRPSTRAGHCGEPGDAEWCGTVASLDPVPVRSPSRSGTPYQRREPDCSAAGGGPPVQITLVAVHDTRRWRRSRLRALSSRASPPSSRPPVRPWRLPRQLSAHRSDFGGGRHRAVRGLCRGGRAGDQVGLASHPMRERVQPPCIRVNTPAAVTAPGGSHWSHRAVTVHRHRDQTSIRWRVGLLCTGMQRARSHAGCEIGL